MEAKKLRPMFHDQMSVSFTRTVQNEMANVFLTPFSLQLNNLLNAFSFCFCLFTINISFNQGISGEVGVHVFGFF